MPWYSLNPKLRPVRLINKTIVIPEYYLEWIGTRGSPNMKYRSQINKPTCQTRRWTTVNRNPTHTQHGVPNTQSRTQNFHVHMTYIQQGTTYTNQVTVSVTTSIHALRCPPYNPQSRKLYLFSKEYSTINFEFPHPPFLGLPHPGLSQLIPTMK